jgi:nucleoid-associated protein YgaU
MTRRETAALAALIDAVAAPRPPLPPVGQTDAIAAFERWLGYAPRLNRAAVRAALSGLAAARFPQRPRAARLALLRRIRPRPAAEALRAAAAVSYYGDAGVLAVLGHDPATRVREARAARAVAVAAGAAP